MFFFFLIQLLIFVQKFAFMYSGEEGKYVLLLLHLFKFVQWIFLRRAMGTIMIQ